MKYREQATVLNIEEIGKEIFSLVLQTRQIAGEAVPGQFVSVYANDRSRLLPRPISICEADEESGCLRLVFRIAGEGTREFSRLEVGDKVTIVGPLGNGFPIERAEEKRVFLIGGGIGIPPMVQLDHTLEEMGAAADVTAVLGFRDEQFLLEDFSCECSSVLVVLHTQLRHAPIPQAIFSSRDSQHSIPSSSAKAFSAWSIGVGPQA